VPGGLGEVGKKSFKSARTKAEWLDYWYCIVTTYAPKHLTFPSDKLPALSGVAGKIQDILGYCYFAGLWKEDLVCGLAWACCETYPKGPMTPIHPTINDPEYRAPSWSWASHEGRIWLPLRGDSPIVKDLEILDVNIQLHGRDPFGRIRSGYLKVHGKVRVGIIRKLKAPNAWEEEVYMLWLYHDCIEVLKIGRYFPDRHSLADTFAVFEGQSKEVDGKVAQQKLLFLLLVRQGYNCMAMAIRPVRGQLNRYRRIGLATNVQLEEPNLGSWFDESESMTLEII
jgi:hypothetical protein